MEKTALKLFAGFLLRPDLKEKLEKNAEWKMAQVNPQEKDLREVTMRNKHYIGIYLTETATFKTLQETEKELKKMLLQIAPDSLKDEMQLQIFSKLFLL